MLRQPARFQQQPGMACEPDWAQPMRPQFIETARFLPARGSCKYLRCKSRRPLSDLGWSGASERLQQRREAKRVKRKNYSLPQKEAQSSNAVPQAADRFSRPLRSWMLLSSSVRWNGGAFGSVWRDDFPCGKPPQKALTANGDDSRSRASCAGHGPTVAKSIIQA